MICRPSISISHWKSKDTHRSLADIGNEERFVEEKFMESHQQNTNDCQGDQTTSDVRLFQPLNIQNKCHIDTFNSDQG
jgi:hypothetical protein